MNASGPKAYTIQGFDSMPADLASLLHLAPVLRRSLTFLACVRLPSQAL